MPFRSKIAFVFVNKQTIVHPPAFVGRKHWTTLMLRLELRRFLKQLDLILFNSQESDNAIHLISDLNKFLGERSYMGSV